MINSEPLNNETVFSNETINTEDNYFGVAPQPVVLVDDTKLEELRAELRGN